MGKKWLALICLILTGLMIWSAPLLWARFPISRDGSGGQAWKGVLRVWVSDDWGSGAMSWITKQASAFEKANPGVRVRIRRADPEDWAHEDAILPDILIFSPGMIDAPEAWLLPIAGAQGILEEALRAGRWQGEQYALPLCLSGYVLLVNEALWPQGAVLQTPAELKKQVRYALHSPLGGALIAMTGWPEGIQAARTLGLREDFGQASEEQAYGAFTSGNVAALVCTLQTARRFSALEATGKGFPYRIETPLLNFTDRMLLIGRPQSNGGQEQNAVADRLLQAFVGLEAQNALQEYGLLSPLDKADDPGTQTPALRALRLAYEEQLIMPNAYAWGQARQELGARALRAVLQDATGFPEALEAVR